MTTSAIAVSGLRKAFKDKVVLEEADQVAVLDHGHLVEQGTPDELKRLIPGTHVRLRLANVSQLDAAALLFPEATRDDDALALRVPSDGGTTSLRSMLDRLDEYGLTADEFSVHTPTSTTYSSP